jgi:hypothetical protein
MLSRVFATNTLFSYRVLVFQLGYQRNTNLVTNALPKRIRKPCQQSIRKSCQKKIRKPCQNRYECPVKIRYESPVEKKLTGLSGYESPGNSSLRVDIPSLLKIVHRLHLFIFASYPQVIPRVRHELPSPISTVHKVAPSISGRYQLIRKRFHLSHSIQCIEIVFSFITVPRGLYKGYLYYGLH